MTAMVDARFAALRAQGYVGSTSDMLLAWLIYNGATTAKTIRDAWAQMLAAKGYPIDGTPDRARNDAWYGLLGAIGYTGTYDDRERAFWMAGGTFGDWIFETGILAADGIITPGGIIPV